ncbi:sulfatase [Draconibacterium mangrovi]|uniref:sulfatase n=1 Tax=Draconibacterium mangrovi TaxID=2697469 RepID=UPI001952DFFF|nr:sulfatase [Draconibacterium mangrovi]
MKKYMRFLLILILPIQSINYSFKNIRQDENEKDKMNVLFIAVDDLRLQAGVYGQSQMITPTLDKLGSEGVVFSRAYCSVPVCGASRASLLSGLRPTPTRFIDYYTKKDEDAPDVPSLPMWFKNNGYTTLSLGKIYHHNNDDINSWSETPYLPVVGIGWQSYITDESKKIVESNKDPLNPRRIIGPAYESPNVEDDKYPDGLLAEKAIEDLKHFSKTGEPFFLAVGFWKPHLPFNAPKKYWDLYNEAEIQVADNPYIPENAPKAAIHQWNELRVYDGIPKEGPVSDSLAKKLIHGYYACVSYTDNQIGKVLHELDRLGLADNTIVVLWGDHGWHLGEHGLWCKHCNFDKVLNAPLIVKAPGKAKGAQTNTLVEFIDIYPTLCDLTGLKQPAHLDGKSFEPVLKDPEIKHKEVAFSRYINGESVITEEFLYTTWLKDGRFISQMLYDRKNDPAENINVAEMPEYKKVVDEMNHLLEGKNATLSKD